MHGVMHIKGSQPSKNVKKKQRHPLPQLSSLMKNVNKIVTTKRKNLSNISTFKGINKSINQKSFEILMKNVNFSKQQRLPINTGACVDYLSKYDAEFVIERTQEISNAKIFFTLKKDKKRHNTTFVIYLEPETANIVLVLLLTNIDFGGMKIEISSKLQFDTFLYKIKESGFRFYYDFIRINLLNKNFIVIRK